VADASKDGITIRVVVLGLIGLLFLGLGIDKLRKRFALQKLVVNRGFRYNFGTFEGREFR
jgi:hypothetical protein